jgi:hypothetical protein
MVLEVPFHNQLNLLLISLVEGGWKAYHEGHDGANCLTHGKKKKKKEEELGPHYPFKGTSPKSRRFPLGPHFLRFSITSQ